MTAISGDGTKMEARLRFLLAPTRQIWRRREASGPQGGRAHGGARQSRVKVERPGKVPVSSMNRGVSGSLSPSRRRAGHRRLDRALFVRPVSGKIASAEQLFSKNIRIIDDPLRCARACVADLRCRGRQGDDKARHHLDQGGAHLGLLDWRLRGELGLSPPATRTRGVSGSPSPDPTI